MTATLATILAAAAGSVGAYFAWKASSVRQRQLAKRDLEAETAAKSAIKSEIEAAVHNRDDAKVNQIVDRLLAPALPALVSCGVLAAALAGCSTPSSAVVYVPADRRIESVTNSTGVACKAVPDVVFAEMLLKLQSLDDLQRELKLDKRLGK